MIAPCKITAAAELLDLKIFSKSPSEWRIGNKGSLSLDLNKDCFYDHEHSKGGGVLDLIQHLGHASNTQEAAQFLEDNGLIENKRSASPKSKKPLREHVYVDGSGKNVRKSVKYTDGSWKQFRWTEESWKPGVKGAPNPPYGLYRLLNDLEDQLCFVFEGEKDVERAWEFGLSATCNSGGAKNWKTEQSEWLKDRKICIVPDNDEAGKKHAKSVEHSLRKLSIDCFILWEYSSDLPEKGDFSDWMDLNYNDIEGFLRLAEQASKRPAKSATQFVSKFNVLDAAALASLKLPPLEFLCDKILPNSGLAMLAGAPKAGKSWQVLCMAKDMLKAGKPVFYIAAEDNHRRLQGRINSVFITPPEGLICHAGLSQDEAIPRGQSALKYLEEIALRYAPSCIIIDTVASILKPHGKSGDYNVSVDEYAALRKLAHKQKMAILVVHHTKKTTEVSLSPLEQILGSTGITATVETILVMENIIGKKDRKLHVTGKDVEQNEFYLAWNGAGYDFCEDAEVAGLGSVQLEVYELIKQYPRCSQGKLVNMIGKDQGQISKILYALQDKDLIMKLEQGYVAK
ncbi:MAG: AAA family ATPase [Paracoccaceae bacterium]|nr:AAA family ATPase [Paracoccaceae bacterium]